MKTQRQIAQELEIDFHAVAAVVDLHGIRPRTVGKAWVIDDKQYARIRSDLQKIRDSRRKRRRAAPAAV